MTDAEILEREKGIALERLKKNREGAAAHGKGKQFLFSRWDAIAHFGNELHSYNNNLTCPIFHNYGYTINDNAETTKLYERLKDLATPNKIERRIAFE